MSAAIPIIKAAAPYISAASSVFSAVSSVSQGKNQQALYNLQAKQAEAESKRKALEYETRANETLRKINTANSANIAKRYSGGVLGLEGSAKLIETINFREGGKDFLNDLTNATNAIMTGSIQSDIYEIAGENAARSGKFDALGKLATGAYEFSKVIKTSDTTKAATGSTDYWKGSK